MSGWKVKSVGKGALIKKGNSSIELRENIEVIKKGSFKKLYKVGEDARIN